MVELFAWNLNLNLGQRSPFRFGNGGNHHPYGNLLKYGTAIAASIGVGTWLYNSIDSRHNRKERQKLKLLVQQKQLEREAELTSLRTIYHLTDELRAIIELPMPELIQKLQTRELSAKKVLEAFIAKTVEITEEFNCVTEFNPKAMEMAEELDKLESPKGSLHGVPFCVKDDTHVRDMDSTVGCAKNLYRPSQHNAIIVQVLEDEGGIPYCRTNLPQTCASYASHNPIFGLTVNPLNKALSPGGSSSGTGCLLGAKGVPFGIGSDTGGSARLPAHFCGVASIKTSKNRVSRKGSMQCVENCIGLPPTPCLMAQRATDVATIFKSLTSHNLMNKYDGKVVPIQWNESIFESSEKLRIGYYTSLEVCPTLGHTPQAILEAKAILESLGHTLIPFDIPKVKEYNKLILQLSYADLGKHFVKYLQNEEISPVIQEVYDFSNIPYWKRVLYSYLPSILTKETSEFDDPKGPLSVCFSSDLWDYMAERYLAKEALLEEMSEMKLDLLLGPVWPTSALPFDIIAQAAAEPGAYLCIWNLLDFPAGVVHAGAKETGGESTEAINSTDSYFTKISKSGLKESVGMPIGVQIIGKPYQEEMVLRAMVELEKRKK